jgi:hypothetical protein
MSVNINAVVVEDTVVLLVPVDVVARVVEQAADQSP